MPNANYLQFLKGANTTVSPFVMDDGSLMVQNGVVTSYKLGAALKDLGYKRVGDVAQVDETIGGLFNFRQSAGTQKILLTVDDATSDDTQLFYNLSGTWTEITDAETAWLNFAGISVEMESFIAYCFFVGYGATDGYLPVASLTGTTFSTSTNVTSMPNAKYIRRYRDRLYIANCKSAGTEYPYRVYFSSVPSAGTITWTVATDFLDVDYSEQITGIGENWDILMIFTEYSAYQYDQTAFKKVFDVGCSAHRTIKNSGAYMIWANRDGVWLSASGARPQNISGPVQDFFRSGTPTTAEVIDEEYNVYVGNATVNGVTYANVKLTFNIPTSSWRWRELGHAMNIFARYNDSGDDRLYMGSTAGVIWEQTKYIDTTPIYADGYVTTYTGITDITAQMETKPFDLGDPMLQKMLKRVTVFAERAVGVQVGFRIFDNNVKALQPYKPLGQLTRYINHFQNVGGDCNLIQFLFTETSKNPYFSIFGISVDYASTVLAPISRK